MKSIFAIILWNQENNADKLYEQLSTKYNDIVIFKKHGIQTKLTAVEIPTNLDTIPKARNYIIRYVKDNITECQYLHILEDNVAVSDRVTYFVDDIQKMMNVLSLNSWFSTIKDPCNYVYAKYNPRLAIRLDDFKYSKFGLSEILFTSHANTVWTIFDLLHATDNELYLSEDYTIPMFYIIEYLATRRNTKLRGELKYMNQYPTIKSEYGAFTTIDFNNTDNNSDNIIMQKEDVIFKQKNVNIVPDNNIDLLLEDLYAILQSKI